MAMNRSNDPDREKLDHRAIALQEEDLSKALSGVTTCNEAEHKKRRIWLFGHFGLADGLGNFGNESTLQAILYHLRRLLPSFEIRCICTGPVATETTHNVRALPISRTIVNSLRSKSRVGKVLRSLFIGLPCELYRWFEGLFTIKRTDVLIVPGTGLISDACGLRGWGPYSLFKWSMIAKMRGCKLLFVSVGAGPIYSRLGRFLVKSTLALADFRSYRDTSSLRYLNSIGLVTTNDRVYPDLAFSLPKDLITHHSHRNRPRPVVGLGVMVDAGKYSVEKPDAATYRNYLGNLLILVKWLLAREYDVRLLIGDLCDRPATTEFKALLRDRLGVFDEDRIVDEPTPSVEALLAQLAECDVVVATRFHNVLLALALNKPVISISFHQKCTSLMQDMGLQEYCQDIQQLNADKLIEQFCQLEKNAARLKHMIRGKVTECRKALDEQYSLIFKDFLP